MVLISVGFIVALLGIVVWQKISHSIAITEQRMSYKMSMSKVHDALDAEWVPGRMQSDAYLRIVEVLEKERQRV